MEIEAVLLISAANPTAVAEKIAALTEIGEYRLSPEPDRWIRDTYFDTPDRQLLSRFLSLRLRRVNGDYRITLKSGASLPPAGYKVRSELELDWSPEAFRAVMEELRRNGVHLGGSTSPSVGNDPLQILCDSGLVVIQERTNHRRPRAVVCSDIASAAPLAEMVIDHVVFHLGYNAIHHYEVEIELAQGQRPQELARIVSALRQVVGETLRPWTMAKLTLGLRLEELLRQGRLSQVTDAEGYLLPEAYDLVASASSLI